MLSQKSNNSWENAHLACPQKITKKNNSLLLGSVNNCNILLGTFKHCYITVVGNMPKHC